MDSGPAAERRRKRSRTLLEIRAASDQHRKSGGLSLRIDLCLYRFGNLFARCAQLGYRIADRQKLHRGHPIVLELGELPVDVLVVDFSRAWLVPARNVGNMH